MYAIADFNIDFVGACKYVENECKDYEVFNACADVAFSVSQDDIEYEKRFADEDMNINAFLEKSAFYRKIAEWLPLHDAFVVHGAVFDVDGAGIMLCARSGVGKTTHMCYWCQLLHKRVAVVNGDKPIVRFFGDDRFPYAYGTPWRGKENFGKNIRTELKHICFIERDTENFVKKLTPSQALERMAKQVYTPETPEGMMKNMLLLDRLLKSCNLWEIHCKPDIDAARVAYNTLFNENMKGENL